MLTEPSLSDGFFIFVMFEAPMNNGRRIIWTLLLLFAGVAHAADSLQVIRSIPVAARLLSMDELGNVYIVRNDNTLIRYSNTGDSTGFYRSVLNGDIGAVDATNPLRILLYYPAYSKVVLLDRMLSEKSQTDLRRRQLLSVPAVATASDGRVWAYDPFNARLLKLDEEGETVRASNDLRQQTGFVPRPVFMLERDRRVYVCDTLKGILIFDQFANYINLLPLPGVSNLQAFDQQLIYRQGSELHSFDMRLSTDKTMKLPDRQQTILHAVIGTGTLAVLYSDRLVIHAWPIR